MELTLLAAALTGVGAAWVGTRVWPDRLPDHPLEKLTGSIAIGMIVGRLTAMAAQGVNPVTNPLEIIFVRGGVATGAAAVGFMASLFWAAGWRWESLDALAPSVLMGLAGWHAGCLWRGACLGSASDLPWAWASPGSAITRHPVEIYAAILLIAGAWGVSRLGWRVLLRSGSALVVAGLARLVTEPMRPGLGFGSVYWYAAAIVLGACLILAGRRLQTSYVDTT